MPLPLAIAAGAAVLRGAMTAATLAPLVKPAIGVAKRFLKQTARPGIGSKVTKGPLMLGKQKLLPSRPGIGKVGTRVLGAAGALGGISAVASHRSTIKPQTRPQPARTGPKSDTRTETKKCCPVGTKRMVCFKRGRVKKRKVKARKKDKPRRLVARKRAKKTRKTRKRKG